MSRLPFTRLLAAVPTIVAIAAFSEPLGAQAGPAERAATFFEVLEARRWRDAAALIHPDRRAAMQDEEMSFLVGMAMQRDAIKAMQDSASSGGIALGSDWGRWRDELGKVGHLPLPHFGDAKTIRSVAELPPLEFVARLLAASAIESDSTVPPRESGLTRRIIGTVVEGHGVAHVLYRLEGELVEPPTDRDAVQLLRLRRRGSEWFVWPLSHNLDIATGTYLRFNILADEGPPDRE